MHEDSLGILLAAFAALCGVGLVVGYLLDRRRARRYEQESREVATKQLEEKRQGCKRRAFEEAGRKREERELDELRRRVEAERRSPETQERLAAEARQRAEQEAEARRTKIAVTKIEAQSEAATEEVTHSEATAPATAKPGASQPQAPAVAVKQAEAVINAASQRLTEAEREHRDFFGGGSTQSGPFNAPDVTSSPIQPTATAPDYGPLGGGSAAFMSAFLSKWWVWRFKCHSAVGEDHRTTVSW